MNNLYDKLTNAYDELDDSEKVALWNAYCDEVNYNEAIPASEVEEIYPLNSFNSVQECIQMYSDVVNDAGFIEYDYVTVGGYGYLEEFDVDDDIDEEELIDYISDGNLYNYLPDSMKEASDSEE